MSLANLNPIRTIAFAGVLAALALPAAAAGVKVNVAGLDAHAAHVAITRAAETVCSTTFEGSPIDRYYLMSSCISDTVAATEAKTSAADHRYARAQITGR